MFALMVLLQHVRFQYGGIRSQRHRGAGHGGHRFQGYGVADRIGRVASPHEGRMAGHENCGHRQRIQVGETVRGSQYQCAVRRPLRPPPGSAAASRAPDRRNGRRAWCRNKGSSAGLGESRGLRTVRVRDAVHSGETAGTAAGASACRKRDAARPPPRCPSRSTTTICSGCIRSYGTPLGLITTSRRSSLKPLTLPQVKVTSPDAPGPGSLRRRRLSVF